MWRPSRRSSGSTRVLRYHMFSYFGSCRMPLSAASNGKGTRIRRGSTGGNSADDGTVDPLVAGYVPKVRAVLEAGLAEYKIQSSPHVVLLDKAWYKVALAPTMVDVLLIWLRDQGLFGEDGVARPDLCCRDAPLDVDSVRDYVLKGPCQCAEQSKDHLRRHATSLAMKMINLGREWVDTYLPHALSKINRVTYGLLTQEELDEGKHNGLASRKYLAVPFMGKDVPSPAAEFAHPDIIIGLSVAAYLHEGMRLENVADLTRTMKDELTKESGTLATRPQFVLFENYIKRPFAVACAAFESRGAARTTISGSDGGESAPTRPLALDVFQESEPKQIKGLYALWRQSSFVIFDFMQRIVFRRVDKVCLGLHRGRQHVKVSEL